MTRLSDEALDAIERRLLLARKRVVSHPYDDAEYATDAVLGTDVTRLLAEVRELREQNERLAEQCGYLESDAALVAARGLLREAGDALEGFIESAEPKFAKWERGVLARIRQYGETDDR